MNEILQISAPPSDETENGAFARIESWPISTIDQINQMNYTTIAKNDQGIPEAKRFRKDFNAMNRLQGFGVFPSTLSMGSSVIESPKNGSKYIEYKGEKGQTMLLKITGSREIKSKPTHINIVSGCCLFSRGNTTAINTDGSSTPLTVPGISIDRPVSEIVVDERLSPYEVESITRLTTTINTFLGGIDIPTTVNINIPRVEYYIYILEAYKEGFVSKDQAQVWFDEVDKRSDRDRVLFAKRINTAQDVSVQFSNITDCLAEYIRSTVQQDQMPDISTIRDIIASQSTLAQILLEVVNPQTLDEINYFGYVYEEIKSGSEEGSCGIAIENPIEEIIYIKASGIMKLLKSQGIEINTFAVYPYLKAVNSSTSGLYDLPNLGLGISGARKIIQQYR